MRSPMGRRRYLKRGINAERQLRKWKCPSWRLATPTPYGGFTFTQLESESEQRSGCVRQTVQIRIESIAVAAAEGRHRRCSRSSQDLHSALDLQLQMFPFLPKKIQPAAHARCQSLLCILQNLRHLPQAGRPLAKLMPGFNRNDRIDHTGSSRP